MEVIDNESWLKRKVDNVEEMVKNAERRVERLEEKLEELNAKIENHIEENKGKNLSEDLLYAHMCEQKWQLTEQLKKAEAHKEAMDKALQTALDKHPADIEIQCVDKRSFLNDVIKSYTYTLHCKNMGAFHCIANLSEELKRTVERDENNFIGVEIPFRFEFTEMKSGSANSRETRQNPVLGPEVRVDKSKYLVYIRDLVKYIVVDKSPSQFTAQDLTNDSSTVRLGLPVTHSDVFLQFLREVEDSEVDEKSNEYMAASMLSQLQAEKETWCSGIKNTEYNLQVQIGYALQASHIFDDVGCVLSELPCGFADISVEQSRRGVCRIDFGLLSEVMVDGHRLMPFGIEVKAELAVNTPAQLAAYFALIHKHNSYSHLAIGAIMDAKKFVVYGSGVVLENDQEVECITEKLIAIDLSDIRKVSRVLVALKNAASDIVKRLQESAKLEEGGKYISRPLSIKGNTILLDCNSKLIHYKSGDIVVKTYDYFGRDSIKEEDRRQPNLEAIKIAYPNDKTTDVCEVTKDVKLLIYKYYHGSHYPRNVQQFKPLVEALQNLHNKGWVHGDVRAANILFQDEDANTSSKENEVEKAIFIDFDFSRLKSESKDPKYVKGYNSKLKERHGDAESGKSMCYHHDWHSLAEVLFMFFPTNLALKEAILKGGCDINWEELNEGPGPEIIHLDNVQTGSPNREKA